MATPKMRWHRGKVPRYIYEGQIWIVGVWNNTPHAVYWGYVQSAASYRWRIQGYIYFTSEPDKWCLLPPGL